jgi:hypothetical protein
LSNLLHYDCINEFKRQYFKDILSFEHLIQGEIKIDKVSFPDGGTDEAFNFWGYQLEKSGIKYLLPSKYADGTEIKLVELLPIIPKDLQKVAYRGNAYMLINRPVPARFKPEKVMSFKIFADSLNDLEHTNPEQRKLLMFIGLTSLMDRSNFRISSPPNFGKDSVVDTLGNLLGGCFTIENPTIAKLEYMTYAKWLAVNEIVDIQKAEWRNIEQFLLSAGAHKPEITKHSRAIANGTKEIMDISKFSLSLLYNDIDCYPEQDKYVDLVTKRAVLDRFPALRLSGMLTEDFNKIKNIDVAKFVEEHFNDYKNLLYTFTYYKQNINKELKRYNASKLNQGLPNRWLINIGRLLKTIDLYCDNQEEFDYWINIINECLQDYKDMLDYSVEFAKVRGRLATEDFKIIRSFSNFTDKLGYIRLIKTGQKTVKGDFWEK